MHNKTECISFLPCHQSMFEAVNKAYEFLCSKSARRTEGPDPVRIVLLLQTQSILFQRYADGMREWRKGGREGGGSHFRN